MFNDMFEVSLTQPQINKLSKEKRELLYALRMAVLYVVDPDIKQYCNNTLELFKGED